MPVRNFKLLQRISFLTDRKALELTAEEAAEISMSGVLKNKNQDWFTSNGLCARQDHSRQRNGLNKNQRKIPVT